jgi:uncharacterized protein (DUF2062 family)
MVAIANGWRFRISRPIAAAYPQRQTIQAHHGTALMFQVTGHFFAKEIVYFARSRHSTARVLCGGIFVAITSGGRAFNVRLNAASILDACALPPLWRSSWDTC